jgi:hypothetical protein
MNTRDTLRAIITLRIRWFAAQAIQLAITSRPKRWVSRRCFYLTATIARLAKVERSFRN